MVTTDARVAIARACYEAYVAKDRTAIEALLAKNFHFTSPIDNRLDRATYFARCWPNSQRIEGFDFIHLVPEGDKVFVTYEGRNTDDPKAVQPFYRDVFGWKFDKFEGGPIEYWLVTTGDDKDPGINGGITRPREGQSSGTLNTIAVSSLDQTIKKIEQRDGKICVPKMAIPKIGWLAYAQDPAGNVFGIIQPDAQAK
jgi:predicted enzyme related to lactoylglutathione lyase